MANMAQALLKHDQIKTTLAKAKALRPFVEKVITLAKHAQSASPERALFLRRLAIAKIRDKAVVKTLFDEKVTEFANRSGGYTRIYKLGTRLGDAAEMAVIQLIPASDEGYAKKKKPASAKKVKASTEAKAAEDEVIEAEEVAETPAEESAEEESKA